MGHHVPSLFHSSRLNMPKLHFSDGVSIDTSGPLRIIRLTDGYYVVGKGFLLPVSNRTEAQQVLKEMKQAQ